MLFYQHQIIMQSPFVAPGIVSTKFMCLEDHLLQALYKEEGPVPIQHLSLPIAITANAALSIVHRIKKAYPQYLIIEDEGNIESCKLTPIQSQAAQVQQFLQEGGFTQINEQEFLHYYEKELVREKRRAQLNGIKARIKRERVGHWCGIVGKRKRDHGYLPA